MFLYDFIFLVVLYVLDKKRGEISFGQINHFLVILIVLFYCGQ